MPFQKSRRARTEHALWYDHVAHPYDRSHAGYPNALVDDVLAYAGLQTGGKVLEIGCGTGQATTSFAARGLEILALEPGANLAALARQNLARYANVEIVSESFESWKLAREAFDLIISGHAFHWVDRRVRFVKAAHALRPGGVLAIFKSVASLGNSTVDLALLRALGGDATPKANRRRWPSERQFSKSRYFTAPEKRRYPFADIFDSEGFANRLECSFSFQRLAPAEREKILDSLRRIITENGGKISVPYECQLIMGHREANISWLRRLLHRKK